MKFHSKIIQFLQKRYKENFPTHNNIFRIYEVEAKAMAWGLEWENVLGEPVIEEWK